jgi:hypothetical protein
VGNKLLFKELFSKSLLLLEVVDFRYRCSLSGGACGEPQWNTYDVLLLRLQEKQHRSELPRRMPCEKNTQVAGTLFPQESRTLHSNQLVSDVFKKISSKATIF